VTDDPDNLGAAIDVGEKVMEMADRLRLADRIVPGAHARWVFEMDDTRYEVTVRVQP